jgi:drug/metabolite transporter (DMT)-like permease
MRTGAGQPCKAVSGGAKRQGLNINECVLLRCSKGTAPVASLAVPSGRPESTPQPVAALGLGLACLAFALFSGMDALVKWLAATYPVHQIVFANGVFALIPVLVWARRDGGLGRLRTRRLGLQITRGLCGMTAASLAFYAFSLMPLTDVYAIIFTTPLLITALSVPVLGERVGWRRWSAIGAGFVGVLIMLRPEGEGIGSGALAALGAACASAISILVMRKLSTTESTASIALYSNLTIVAGAGAALGWHAVAPTLVDLLLMAMAGVLGGVALIVLISAYRLAPAALVAPFQYGQMIWGALLGFVIWGHLPDAAVVAGASIVAASGLFILYRETTLGRRPTASLHPGAVPRAAAAGLNPPSPPSP